MTTETDGALTWGSHQPALRALAKFTKIRSVIEFGAGPYSTHLFLDREAFPDLASLVTFEHKEKWAEEVRVGDSRHTLIIVPAEDFDARSEGMIADFVFLDCAPKHTRFDLFPSSLTIAHIVGIHDCSAVDVSRFECKYVKDFNSVVQTVFASNSRDLSGLEIE